MIDISDVEIVDFHAHRMSKSSLSEVVKAYASRHDNNIETELKWPHWRGFFNYLAKIYECNPTLEEIERELSRRYEGDFLECIRSVLDREKIVKVQIVSDTDSLEGVGEFPKERCVWAICTNGMMDPDWAKDADATRIDEVLTAIDMELDVAIKNGCSCLKNILCYNRSLSVDVGVTKADADKAYQRLRKTQPVSRAERQWSLPLSKEAKPTYFGFVKPPTYEDTTDIRSLQVYQDYLVKYLTIRAGELGLPYAFHTGAGTTPTYDLRDANPQNLLPLLYDHDVNAAGTKIVILHSGVPFINVAAAIASILKNVYVDSSWPTQTTIVRDIFKYNLELNPPTKILYGTDSFWIPERLAHGAWNARKQLTGVLSELNKCGWSEEECMEIAKLVLAKNAKKLLNIP